MDTSSGRVYSAEEVDLMRELGGVPDGLKPIDAANLTPEALASMKVGRNDPCPCGSERKFKKCCLRTSHEQTCESVQRKARERVG